MQLERLADKRGALITLAEQIDAALNYALFALMGLGAAGFTLTWAMDQRWDGRFLAGARVYSEQNYQLGLSIMLGFAIVGLLGAMTIRETNCAYITLTQR